MNKSATQSKLSDLIIRTTPSLVTPSYDYVENYIVIPPDGGYGWFIVFATFVCYFLVDGVMYTFGLFILEISESMEVKSTEIALASSLMGGFYFLVGPLTCAFCNRYGFRVVGIIGGFVSGLAFLLSTFFTNHYAFMFLIGFMCGVGFNMIYIPCLLVVGFYFDKWRALATAISLCGSSLGVIAFPPMVSSLMKNLHWTWKFRILSALTFLMCGFAFSFRPIKPTRLLDPPSRKFTTDDAPSIYSFNIDRQQDRRSIFSTYHNTLFPTAADLQDASSVYTITKKADDSVSEMSTPRSMFINRTDNLSMSLSTVRESDEDQLKGQCAFSRLCRKIFCCNRQRGRRFVDLEEVNRPMYRDDIFFTGSVNLSKVYSKATLAGPQASAHRGNISYHKSVTRVPTQRDVEQNAQCLLCPEAVIRTIVTMLHLGLLKSLTFVVLTISGFFSFVGLYCPYIFLVERGMEMQLGDNWSNLLLTFIGVANTLGRIACGVISWFPSIDIHAISYVTLIVAGLTIIVSSYLKHLWGQILFCCVFGFCIASLTVLRSIIVVDLMGLENLTNAFGITSMFFGLGCFIGVPVASALYDYTRTFDASFLFSGCSIIISGILIIPLRRISSWEGKVSRRVSFRD